MSTYVSNRNGGGQTDEQGHYRFQTKVWTGNILSGFGVKQNSPLARNVLVPAGDIKIDYGQYSYTAWNDADATVAISTADTTNPRLDRIVAYIDRSLTSGGTNNPGYLKFMAIAGTPGAVPVKATDVATQAAVTAAAGAVASPWVELAVVRVEANATTIPDSKITDTRVFITLPANSVNAAAIPDNTITPAKLTSGMPVQVQSVSNSALATGTTVIPKDDTIPQSSEGTQFMSLSFTPKFAGSKIIVQVRSYQTYTVITDSSGAIFQSGSANAIGAQSFYQDPGNAQHEMVVTGEFIAASTAPVTISYRGGGSTAGTMTFNGQGSSRTYGGAAGSSIIVTEVKA